MKRGAWKRLLGFICLGAVIVGAILVISDPAKRNNILLQAPNDAPPATPPRELARPVPPTPPAPPRQAYTEDDFPWLTSVGRNNPLACRIAPPSGFVRTSLAQNSFGDWLRYLPLKPGRPAVMLFNGRPKPDQTVHEAVIDLDTGDTDLQQCADCIIRLRAEYLFGRNQIADIHFNASSGDRIDWSRWAAGERPAAHGQRLTWRRSGRAADSTHANFREYMKTVFQYAGTKSLARELESVDERDVRVGDVFIHPGSPGHAVLVVDLAVDRAGHKLMLLAQGYMPAQDMHILRNLARPALGAWFDANFSDTLRTPEWAFNKGELKRFR
jgi:hypothetical protein